MGWRLLNGSLNPRVQCVPLRMDETPELVYVRVSDQLQFAFDPNSMALLQVDSVQDYMDLRKNPPSPYVMAKYKPSFERAPGTPKIKNLVIETTHDCNLACSYCFVRNYYEDHGTGNYTTAKTAKSTIDRLLDPKDGMAVGFFGGEPLLNMALIRDVVEYVEAKCKAAGTKASFHVTTNGTLYSEDNIKFLQDHGFSLITSIDGTAEAHDALRPMKRSGKGSHKQIVDGLKRLAKYPIAQRNTLRSTFTAMPGETIRERLEYLNQLCDDGMANWVSVEPAAMSEGSCFIPNQDELEIHVGNVWNRFHDEYMDAADWWMERARAGKTPRFHNIHKSLERIFWTQHAGSECGAGAGYASVNARGEIFGCHRESNSYIGTLVTGIDPKLRAPWLDNRIYNRTGCMTCGHRYACGGGCREDSMGDHGDIHSPSNVHCALKDLWTRMAFKVMAELPKTLIKQFCREPSRGNKPSRELFRFIPSDQLPRDEYGILQNRWVGNIPITALAKDSLESLDWKPEITDQPVDKVYVDQSESPHLYLSR